jgi:hypothetical protein
VERKPRHRRRLEPGEHGLEARLEADGDHPRVGRRLEKSQGCRERDRGSVVTPHRINGYGDRHVGLRKELGIESMVALAA